MNSLILKPLEFIAGRDFPSSELKREMSPSCETLNELDYMMSYERSKWRTDLLHFEGLRNFIDRTKGDK
jgi:hypothetical protein